MGRVSTFSGPGPWRRWAVRVAKSRTNPHTFFNHQHKDNTMPRKQSLQALLLISVTFGSAPALAQSATGPQRNPYETCIAAEAAKAGGGMVAEAKARRACRERYPDQAAETNRRTAVDAAGLAAGATGSASGGTSASTSGTAAATGAGGGAATPASTPTGTTPAPTPSPAASPSPASPPGLSGGNPHGGPPGQAKK
jgi:hypothetical protein